MKIRKGSQVEVWTKDATSSAGAWRGGEVQGGNGHSYILRWHDGGPDSGHISRKRVRPCPPPAPVTQNLDAGDLVEVFDEEDGLWKRAEVERVPGDGGGQFRVKVVGATNVLTVAPNRLRLRQIFRQDNVWVVLHKDNRVAGASATPLLANGNDHVKPMAPGSNPPKQRRSPGMFDTKAIANGKKLRYDNNVEMTEPPKLCPSKQDESSSSSDEDDDAVATDSNSNQDEDDDPLNPKPDLRQPFLEKDHRDDAAESRGSLGRSPLDVDEKAVAQEQHHRLELDAYTSLTRAFRAAGDRLSWEKAELLAELREHLHISNDEHLQVINAGSKRNKGRRSGWPGDL